MDDFNTLDRFEDRVADMESVIGGAEGIAAAFNREMVQLQATVAQTQREIGALERGISHGLKRAIDGLVFDGDTLSHALKGVGRSMLDAAYNAAVRPVATHAGSVLGSGLEAVIQGLMPFANGASFAQGRVQPFATGGIVSQATYFPMRGGAGVMGEAGPEAIMPLARGANGKLGVQASGGGRSVHVTMNITTPDVQGFQRSQSQIAAQLSRAVGRGQRNR
ncbi:phage tail tape measure protein [Celeribacter marinus]|uniref:phage tail tape measure protein n=1 Tax=Celeribacter marinus TaxID=1397108 RepID=UPI003178F4E4